MRVIESFDQSRGSCLKKSGPSYFAVWKYAREGSRSGNLKLAASYDRCVNRNGGGIRRYEF